MRPGRLVGGLASLLAALVVGCGRGAEAPAVDAAGTWSDDDWGLFTSKVAWALAEGLDTLPTGDAIARLGRSFVGTPYVPRTLEVPGEERLVINFRGLDCVTFVENVFALTRFLPSAEAKDLADRDAAQSRYESLLRELRYREGRIDGYPSRLHYFTDWVGNNERKGLLADLTRSLGGVVDEEPVDFMTAHPEAYHQLADTASLSEIRRAEARLTRTGRFFIPEETIEAAAPRIRNGDIIAATSTVPGLDVAHTGIALWVDGALHLLHAPLVGEQVQISTTPLADRIRRLAGQDGIIVARPRDQER